MTCGKRPLLIFLCFLFLPDLNALDLHITKIELGLDIRGEYNRTFYYGGDIALTGAIELNDFFCAKIGLSLGGFLEEALDIKSFGSFHITPLAGYGLEISLAYIYNGLPKYETHSSSILPYISYNGRWAGISLGVNFRFTSFFGEPPLYESMLSFSGYINFVNVEMLVIGIKCANFYDFYAGNMGSYSFAIYSRVNFNKNWSVISDLELLQSGSVGLSATFYGIAVRMGIRYLW
jgi:hypothetical protein